MKTCRTKYIKCSPTGNCCLISIFILKMCWVSNLIILDNEGHLRWKLIQNIKLLFSGKNSSNQIGVTSAILLFQITKNLLAFQFKRFLVIWNNSKLPKLLVYSIYFRAFSFWIFFSELIFGFKINFDKYHYYY